MSHSTTTRLADTYLMWGEPPAAIAERVARIRTRAAEHGRAVRLGIRLHVIARESAEEAWAEAARMAALHAGTADDLEISPNLWAGIGLVREGAGTALVGSYTEVAARLREYAALGLDEFILSAWPHLEEAYRIGEYVLPLV